jgi:hypothetical protein
MDNGAKRRFDRSSHQNYLGNFYHLVGFLGAPLVVGPVGIFAAGDRIDGAMHALRHTGRFDLQDEKVRI